MSHHKSTGGSIYCSAGLDLFICFPCLLSNVESIQTKLIDQQYYVRNVIVKHTLNRMGMLQCVVLSAHCVGFWINSSILPDACTVVL